MVQHFYDRDGKLYVPEDGLRDPSKVPELQRQLIAGRNSPALWDKALALFNKATNANAETKSDKT